LAKLDFSEDLLIKVPDLEAEPRYSNREMSWLDFTERILALADDRARPLLERLRFIAIFNRNLDEFFQIRVAALKEQRIVWSSTRSPSGMLPKPELDAIRDRARQLTARCNRILFKKLIPELAESGIRVVSMDDLNHRDKAHVRRIFQEQVFPVLTPLSMDLDPRWPHISNLSLNLAIGLRDPETRSRGTARVKVPSSIPRFLQLPGGKRLIPLEDVVAAHVKLLFPGMEIVQSHPFRVTRDADVQLNGVEAEDLLAAMELVFHPQRDARHAVRLEVPSSMPAAMRETLADQLGLEQSDIYVSKALLGAVDVWQLAELDRPGLKETNRVGVTQLRLARSPLDVFETLKQGDVLVHHPYESFATSVEAFIEAAASDPNVLAIKQTIYRTSEKASPILRALIRAAEEGKQVVALVELNARFDEEANMGWTRVLEEAGVHVVYGMVGLTTHAKISLVIRDEAGAIRRYCHVGTGNYHPETAKTHEDLSLLTADPEITADVADLFNYLTGYCKQAAYRKILAAPATLRRELRELIRGEAAPGGRIVMKMNGLADTEMIEELYAAAAAGASIDLIVRGICCLRPGIVGLSENISVRSIVGRHLEHSRVFRFGGNLRGPRYFIGSADLMTSNLDDRVECVVPVSDPRLVERLESILRLGLQDDTLAYELGADGWSKVAKRAGVDSQTSLMDLAAGRAT
jgi:polyphosphate kinase